VVTEPWQNVLRNAICDSFSIHEVGEGRWSIGTPLLYEDGDGLPVIVEYAEGAWSLSDNGYATSHLFFDDFEHTDARADALRRLVHSARMNIDDSFTITCDLDGPPDPYDVGDFLQVIAQVQGLARSAAHIEREGNYRPTMRKAVTSLLVEADFEENWLLPEFKGRQARYSVDLAIGSGASMVPVFFASTSRAVSESTVTVLEMRHRDIATATPLLAYDNRGHAISSNEIKRFQDQAGDDVVVHATPENTRGLVRKLAERGVLISQV
jgi:hypothetical protein